jgi:hypothetical protein
MVSSYVALLHSEHCCGLHLNLVEDWEVTAFKIADLDSLRGPKPCRWVVTGVQNSELRERRKILVRASPPPPRRTVRCPRNLRRRTHLFACSSLAARDAKSERFTRLWVIAH